MSRRHSNGGGGNGGGGRHVTRIVSVVSDTAAGSARGGGRRKRPRDEEDGSLPPAQHRRRDGGDRRGDDWRGSRGGGGNRHDDRADDRRRDDRRESPPRSRRYDDRDDRDDDRRYNGGRRDNDRDDWGHRDRGSGGGRGGIERERYRRAPSPMRNQQQQHRYQQNNDNNSALTRHSRRPASTPAAAPARVPTLALHAPSSPDYPPPTEAECFEENMSAAAMVRQVLPMWTKSTLPNDLWTYDPRTNCMRRRNCLVSSMCTGGLNNCNCPKFPTLPILTPTILHVLLPKASSAGLLRAAKNEPAAVAPVDIEVEGEEEEGEEEEGEEKVAEKNDDADEEIDEDAEEEDDINNELEPFLPAASFARPASSIAATATIKPRRILGETTGQFAFKNGVLVTDGGGVRFISAEEQQQQQPPIDQTCAFPFAYEPFRPTEDEPRLQKMRALLFDRFWGPDAPAFLAYLASAYTGDARGRLVVSRPGSPPPQMECMSDDPERRSATVRHHAAVIAEYKTHQNTGPQFLERVLKGVHGEKEVQQIARLNEQLRCEDLQQELQSSHVVACDVRRFTTQLNSKPWVEAHGHQRMVWCRPAESEIMFSENIQWTTNIGPGSKEEKAVAAFRGHQKLARFDAQQIMLVLRGETRKRTPASEAAAVSDPPAYGAFVMWPLPVLPVFDRFTVGGEPRIGIASYRSPLAREMRVVKHTSWTPDDTAAPASEWFSQLQALTDVSTPALQAQLRRCWVELMVRSRRDDIWVTTRLSKFSVNAFGVPDALQELTEDEKAAAARAKSIRGSGPAAAAAAAATIDTDEDCDRRGLRLGSGTQWKWYIAKPMNKGL